MVRLLSALFLSMFISYTVYRALGLIDALLSSIIGLGLMMSLPFTLIFLFYGRVQWAKYALAFIWAAYLVGIWTYMLVSMVVTLPSYLWIPVMAAFLGGIVTLAIWKRKKLTIPWPLQRDVEPKVKGLEEGLEEREELGRLEEGNKELSTLVESLNEIECKILLMLLESERQYSKKELQGAVKATYSRVLRAVDELSRLGLVEVTELPRRTRGAPIQHMVKASEDVLKSGPEAKRLVEKRLVRLEKAGPSAK
ncbi:MAG: hypothetical protein QXI20_10530 [Candidatus Jordarchaeales archaeon]